jgi:nucleoside-diphosphate-sugar epimerase
MKVLVTGANGYIGKSLYSALKDKYEVTILTRKEVDLTDSRQTEYFFRNTYFDVVLHCAIAGAINTKDTDWSIADNNLTMYYNLLQNKNHFKKLINLGSGAEIYLSKTPYGLSKKVIANSILNKNNFYNLRIFGVFDENELDTRFIKANIKRYINKEPILIYQNRYMDFIYMFDLIKIVEYYINNEGPKEIDCKYSDLYSLENIANIINNLDTYKVEIKTAKNYWDETYNGIFHNLSLDFIGLEQGIKEVYNKLK